MRRVTACILTIALASCGGPRSQVHGKRVIVLGVDGMDPNFVERNFDVLPNLRRLRQHGGLYRLATTTPPQSPVAWSTFITGLDPAEHGIFDFVQRDPATLLPLSSMGETLEPAHQLRLGPYVLPLSHAEVRSFRHGTAFWETLSRHGIPVTVLRMPINYPPVPAGQALAGMGTPDLEGTFGTFTDYTDDPSATAGPVSGGRIVPVAAWNHRVVLPIEGPPDSLRNDRAPAHLDLVAEIDPDAPVMRGRVGGQVFILQQGEWSPWIRVYFSFVPHVAGAAGMFRLYAKELHPGIRIYRSPLNADPSDPALPISAPAGFSRKVASRIGPFYTQGIEEDTSAVRAGALDLSDYLEQSRIVSGEHLALLRDSLDHFHDGLLFFYFSEIDQNSHLLWGKHEAELRATYQTVDRAIGEVTARAPDATVIVMSDHGFTAFGYSVNLNTWLLQQGFLQLDAAHNIDWSRTRAYALGLNALYVNLAGREKFGIVQPSEKASLMADLSRKLDATSFVRNVMPVGKTDSRYAPDLIVGYAPGYRASWETGLGEIPDGVIEINTGPWIGDHCIAADAVPGVLMGTLRPAIADPSLKDLPVTIIRLFGLQPDAAMTGRYIYK